MKVPLKHKQNIQNKKTQSKVSTEKYDCIIRDNRVSFLCTFYKRFYLSVIKV